MLQSILLLLLILNVTLREILWVVTLVLMLWIGFWRVLKLYYIVHFGNHLEIPVPNSIAEEPLFRRNACPVHHFTLVVSETYPNFITIIYPALFVSPKYINFHQFTLTL